MKYLSLKITLLLVFALGGFYSHAHVPHDIIYSLDASPDFANDGMILASSTQFGENHLVSHNYGETFSESHKGMKRTLVTGHVYSPDFKNDGVVYMVTKKGYYKSTDRGNNWVKQKLFGNEQVLSICLAPAYLSTKNIYVLTKTGVFFVENDGVKHQNIKSFRENSFGKLKIVGNTLFVHTVYYKKQKEIQGMEHIDFESGIIDAYNFDDKTWTVMAPKFENVIISDYDIATFEGGYVIVVALKDGTVFLSNNFGKHWKEIFTRNKDYVVKIAFSPNYINDHTLAVGTAKGFAFLTENKGEDWVLKSNGLTRWVYHTDILVTQLSFSPNYKNDQTIFLGKTTGFYKTTDKGEFWRHINVWNTKWGYYALPAPGKGSQDVFTATYNSGLSRSHDNGSTWHSANTGIRSAFANGMVISPNYAEDKSIFVIDIATGLYRSTNAGKSWLRDTDFDVKKFYDKPSLHRELGVSNNFKDNGIMLFFTVPDNNVGTTEKMVWKYNDHTKETKRIKIGTSSNYLHSFVFTPKDVEKELMFCASHEGVFISHDLGDTWEKAFKGLGAREVFISPNFKKDGLVFIMNSGGKLFRSDDAGKSFQYTDLGLGGQYISNLTFSPTYSKDQTLYVTTFGEGVLKSTNDGASWNYFGLKGKFLYTGLTFSANYDTDRTIFAPAIDGIYRTQDGGKIWKNVLDKTQFLAKVPFVTLKDPNGKAIDLDYNKARSMRKYDMYDEEIGAILFPPFNGCKKVYSPKAYLASYYKFNVNKGYAAEIYFYGNSIDFKCVQSSDGGIVNIILDGKMQGKFDMYQAQDKFDVSGYKNEGLNMGFHTLRIEATGLKNKKSNGTSFSFNAATIEN